MYEEFKKISGLEDKPKFEYNDSEIDTDSVKRFFEKPEVTVINMLCDLKNEVSAINQHNEELEEEISCLKKQIEVLQKQNAMLKDEIAKSHNKIVSMMEDNSATEINDLQRNQEKMMNQISSLKDSIKKLESVRPASNNLVSSSSSTRGPVGLKPIATVVGDTVSEEFLQDLFTFPKRYRKDDEWIYYIHSDYKMYKVHYDGTNNQVIFNGRLSDHCYTYDSDFKYDMKSGIITFEDSDYNRRQIKVK